MTSSVSASRSRSPVVGPNIAAYAARERRVATVLIQRAVDAAAEADDAAGAGVGDEPHLTGLARLEPGRGPGRDIEAAAAHLVAVEPQRSVRLVKMIVRTDLDRSVAGIGDGQRDRR